MAQISEKFPTQIVEKKLKRKFEENIAMSQEEVKKVKNLQLVNSDIPEINEISTLTPAEDFFLLEEKIQFPLLVLMLEKVIFKLLKQEINGEFEAKVLKCVKIYKEASEKRQIWSHFNNFLSELKAFCGSTSNSKLWEKLEQEKLIVEPEVQEPLEDEDLVSFRSKFLISVL